MRLTVIALALLLFVGSSAWAIKESIIEIFPRIYVIQNDGTGIHERDYFSIFGSEYEYVSAFIDDRKLTYYKPKDDAHADLAREMLSNSVHDEIYLVTYTFPRLRAGHHTLRLSLSKELDADQKAIPIVQILTDMSCKPIPLMFLVPSQREPCSCILNPHSSEMIRRPW